METAEPTLTRGVLGFIEDRCKGRWVKGRQASDHQIEVKISDTYTGTIWMQEPHTSQMLFLLSHWIHSRGVEHTKLYRAAVYKVLSEIQYFLVSLIPRSPLVSTFIIQIDSKELENEANKVCIYFFNLQHTLSTTREHLYYLLPSQRKPSPLNLDETGCILLPHSVHCVCRKVEV